MPEVPPALPRAFPPDADALLHLAFAPARLRDEGPALPPAAREPVLLVADALVEG